MRITSATGERRSAVIETDFEYEDAQLAEAYRRFPAHRLHPPVVHHPHVDVSYLREPNAEFGRHAWDEGGH
jgi:hypothetical protein